MNQLFEISDKYLEVRGKHNELGRERKALGEQLEELEWQLIQTMDESDLKSFKRNGINITAVTTPCLSAEADRKHELWDLMRDKGYESLFSINAQTLQAELRRMLEENGGQLPDWLEGLVKQYDKRGIQVRKGGA